ncbi:MAG: hypothetical protein H7256_06350 [Bdellovibrio sp.]|nr:hypothetical protein [Bdellovibrio sp.]
MSINVNFLKSTTDLIETSPEIKSFIYQQILDFDPFVTSETVILVLARDPHRIESETDSLEMTDDEKIEADKKRNLHRIAIILKENDSSIEAEAFHENIYEAIKLAKEKLVTELIEIQNEIENPTERLNAIQQAGNASQIH